MSLNTAARSSMNSRIFLSLIVPSSTPFSRCITGTPLIPTLIPLKTPKGVSLRPVSFFGELSISEFFSSIMRGDLPTLILTRPYRVDSLQHL